MATNLAIFLGGTQGMGEFWHMSAAKGNRVGGCKDIHVRLGFLHRNQNSIQLNIVIFFNYYSYLFSIFHVDFEDASRVLPLFLLLRALTAKLASQFPLHEQDLSSRLHATWKKMCGNQVQGNGIDFLSLVCVFFYCVFECFFLIFFI